MELCAGIFKDVNTSSITDNCVVCVDDPRLLLHIYITVRVIECGLGVAWCESSLKVLCLGFSFGQWSCPQKCSCVRDLTAQASGQTLIRGSESTGSASRSVLPSIGPSPTLLFSTLLHLCVYLQPADLSVPPLPQDLLRPSFHQRKTSPLTLSIATTAVFIR